MSNCEHEHGLICPECGSDEVYYENPNTGSGLYTCQDCEFMGNEEDFNYSVPVKEFSDLRAKLKAAEKLSAGLKLKYDAAEKTKDKLMDDLIIERRKSSGHSSESMYFMQQVEKAEKDRDALQKQVVGMWKVLEWYADKSNYYKGDWAEVIHDAGERARKALAAFRGGAISEWRLQQRYVKSVLYKITERYDMGVF
ncbi:MAG: hypothetical protein ABFC57_06240 [Veillonellales bacterium]